MTFIFPGVGPLAPLQGLIPFAHAATSQAVVDAMDFTLLNSDLLCFQEGGQDAGLVDYIASRFLLSDKPRYLAVRLKEGRDHLDRVMNLVSRFQPDYLNYGIEANDAPQALQDQIPGFYAALKAQLSIPVMLSFQTTIADSHKAIHALLPYTDMVGISTYPYAALTQEFDYTLRAAAGNKPMVITETCFPAEPVRYDFFGRGTRPGNPTRQAGYIRFLKTLDVEFFVWFVYRDYDDLWANFLEPGGADPLHLLWKDTGLLTGDGTVRPALSAWRRPRTPFPLPDPNGQPGDPVRP